MYRILFAVAFSLTFNTFADASEVITGQLSLSPELATKTSPNDTVFLFARAVNGPRMPLAAIRARVADLPLDFRLDDSMAMAPMARLSNYEQVIITARISATGNVQAMSGDLEGESPIIKPGQDGVELVINHVIP